MTCKGLQAKERLMENKRGASQPLGYQSRDLNVFKDTDGTGYLLSEDRANGLRIDKLSADYTSVVSAVYLFADYEAPAIYKSGSTYFMFASHLSGWGKHIFSLCLRVFGSLLGLQLFGLNAQKTNNSLTTAPNDNVYATATNLSGPWSSWANFATVGTNTFSSQTAAVVSINGVVLYMGDRWHSSNLMTSTYVWLPLTISGTTATLSNQVNWIINPTAGTWTTGPSETWPEAEATTNTLTNGAITLTCSGCSGGSQIGYIGGPSPGGILSMNGVSSSVATTTSIRIHHTNGDSVQRYANVVVNGISNTIAFLPTTDGNTPGTSVLTTALKSGTNVIEFESYDSGWGKSLIFINHNSTKH
ncbi:hypothetical protein NHQ30_011580 [Ciborinia camelliae]|nr:hypothetical protein NHQ30_011580 [Ciborinia camelliae]